MRILFYLLLTIVISSCTTEYSVDDVSSFKKLADSTQLLLAKLSKDGKICEVLIHDSISEIFGKNINFNSIYLQSSVVSHKRIRDDAFVLEDVDSVIGISKVELSKLKENLQLLSERYNILVVESNLSAEDSTNSNNIYFSLNTMGEYYDLRYLSFISEDIKQSHWFESFEIVWEKDGLNLIKHRHF